MFRCCEVIAGRRLDFIPMLGVFTPEEAAEEFAKQLYFIARRNGQNDLFPHDVDVLDEKGTTHCFVMRARFSACPVHRLESKAFDPQTFTGMKLVTRE